MVAVPKPPVIYGRPRECETTQLKGYDLMAEIAGAIEQATAPTPEQLLAQLIEAADMVVGESGQPYLVVTLSPQLLDELCAIGADAAEAEDSHDREEWPDDEGAWDGDWDGNCDAEDSEGLLVPTELIGGPFCQIDPTGLDFSDQTLEHGNHPIPFDAYRHRRRAPEWRLAKAGRLVVREWDGRSFGYAVARYLFRRG